ncbi:uncharacterized protein LOC131301031 isoform X3 [Rhododendron vialii]|uniref:uncharacterized protein LOC131301031 isoform X3 n=1 Tax=Rhododendron vialii TaxID=182163 RepID=UPI00265F35AD|nr:uncharacterized protein LOC131301031 isoform X3 [Rhododendron vialii]
MRKQQRCSGCKNWSSIMDSVCSCFHVPEVDENVESNSSNHSGGARIKKPEGPSYNLKTKYGRLPNNQNITPKISSGMIMQLSSNSGATSKASYLESSKKLPGKVLMTSKVGHLNSISEEEDDVCRPADQKKDVCRPANQKKDVGRLCGTCLKEFAPIDPEITAQCGHMYHLKCMYEWLERSGKCPVCAKAVDGV